MTNQGGVQQAVRDSTGTALDYNGDWSALFDADGIAAGQWSGRMLAWINATLSTSYVNVNEAMQAFAVDQGFNNWSSMNTFTLSLAAALLGTETSGLAIDFTDDTAIVRDSGVTSYNSTASGLLTYTSPSVKYILNASGVLESGSTIRTEYDANGDPIGVRVEVERTNLLWASNDISNATYWVPSNCTVGSATTAPDGTASAYLLYPNSTGSNRWIGNTNPPNSAAVHTQSIYVKAATWQWVYMLKFDGSAGAVWFDLTNGIKGTEASGYTGTIDPIGNGWYRISITGTAQVASNSLFGLSSADNSLSATASGTNGVYMWGGQAELGAYATSLIATTTGTVTRDADSGIGILTSAYPHSATVNSAMIRYRPLNVASAMVALRWDDGTADEVVSVGHSAAAVLNLTVKDGGADQTDPLTSGTATANTWEKVAVSWKANDFLFSDNGATAVADVTGTLPTVTSLDIGPTLSGHISQILVVPVEKSAAEVAAMATP